MAGILDSQNQQGLVAQIIAQAPNTEIALAMLMGSLGESTQNPLSSGSGGYGAFGFTPPSAWGLNMQTVWNPADAVAAILPAYEAAYYGRGTGNGAADAIQRAQQAGAPGGASALGSATPAGAAEFMNIAAEGPRNDIAEMQAIMGAQNGFNRPGGMAQYGAASSENVNQNYNLAVQELAKAGNQVGPAAAQQYVQASGGAPPGAQLASYTQAQSSPAGNAPGSLPGGPNNIPNAPTMEPGTTSSLGGPQGNIPILPGSKLWPQVEKAIKAQYPTFSWLLYEPDVQKVLSQAVSQQASSTLVQSMMAQTQWWKTTNDAIRQWQQTVHTDGTQAQYLVSQGIRNVQDIARTLNIQLSPHDLQNGGTQAAEFQWNSDQIMAFINSHQTGGQVLSQQYLQYVQGNSGELNFTTGSKGRGVGQQTAADQAYHAAVQQLTAAGLTGLPEDFIKSLAMQSMMAGSNWDWQSEIQQLANSGQGQTKYAQGYLQQLLQNPQEFQYTQGKQPWQGPTEVDQAMAYLREALPAFSLSMSTQQMENLISKQALPNGWLTVDPASHAVSVNSSGQLAQYLAQLANKQGATKVSAAYAQQALDNPAQLKFDSMTQPWVGASQASKAAAYIRHAAAGIAVNLTPQDLMKLTRQAMMTGALQVQADGTVSMDSSGQLADQLAALSGKQGAPKVTSQYAQQVLQSPGEFDFTSQGQPYKGATDVDHAAAYIREAASALPISLSAKQLRTLAQTSLEDGSLTASGDGTISANSDGQLAQTLAAMATKANVPNVTASFAQQVLQDPGQFVFSKSSQPWLGATYADKTLDLVRSTLGNGQFALSLSTKQLEQIAGNAFHKGWVSFGPSGVSVSGDQLAHELASVSQQHGLPQASAPYFQQILSNPTEYQLPGPGQPNYSTPWLTPDVAGQTVAAIRNALAPAGVKVSNEQLTRWAQAADRMGYSNNATQLAQYIATQAQQEGLQYVNPAELEDALGPGFQRGVAFSGQNTQSAMGGGTLYDRALNTAYNLALSQGLQFDPNVLRGMIPAWVAQGMFNADGSAAGSALSNALGQHSQQAQTLDSTYLTQFHKDPTEYSFSNKYPLNLAHQMLTQVEVVAGQQQVNLTLAQAQEIATRALQHGLNSAEQIQPLLEPYIELSQGQPAARTAVPANADAARAQGAGAELGGQPAQNTAPGLTQQLRTTAAQYLLSPTDPALQQWERQIAGGTQDMTQFEAYLAQQAADKYPGMAQLIQQGQTPAQITSNLQNLASSTLEISPDQVNFINNPQFQKMLDGGYNETAGGDKQPNGQMMTYSQAGQYLRGLPQFQYTTNAHSDAGNLETAILQAFGRVG